MSKQSVFSDLKTLYFKIFRDYINEESDKSQPPIINKSKMYLQKYNQKQLEIEQNIQMTIKKVPTLFRVNMNMSIPLCYKWERQTTFR